MILSFEYHCYDSAKELNMPDQELFETACKASGNAYAPYSCLHVGAAARLENGEIVYSCNQENSSYPVTLCAERALMAHINSNHKGLKINTIAIVATKDGVNADSSPCGVCRQTLSEVASNQEQDIRVIFSHRNRIIVVQDTSMLLPFTFHLTNN